MTSTQRILVVAPHGDDEVYGCGGTLARAASEGAEITRVVMATGGIRHHHLGEAASTEARLGEIRAAGAVLGIASTEVLHPGLDMQLESVSMLRLVTALDRVLAEGAFDEVYLPEPSHNLDHRRTHEAVLTALRPRGLRMPRLVAAYEGTGRRWRSPAGTGGRFYVDISATLDRKLAALREYRSQVQAFPHPLSEEAVRRLAGMRGLECGVEAAERFHLLSLFRP